MNNTSEVNILKPLICANNSPYMEKGEKIKWSQGTNYTNRTSMAQQVSQFYVPSQQSARMMQFRQQYDALARKAAKMKRENDNLAQQMK